MITLYASKTPNCQKISIAFEELELPYELKMLDLRADEQNVPEFLSISPNGKVPAIVDHDAEGGRMSLFESGAILTYLGDRTGRLLAPSGTVRYATLAWLHWQTASLGPNFGQLGAFALRLEEKLPTAIDRFRTEVERLFGVMERRLSESDYLAGPDYSIADIAAFPWASVGRGNMAEMLGLADSVATKPALQAWLDTISARPAVVRGLAALAI